jgi:hypothetical protein
MMGQVVQTYELCFIQPILNSSISGKPIPSRGVGNGPSVILMVESVAGSGIYFFLRLNHEYPSLYEKDDASSIDRKSFCSEILCRLLFLNATVLQIRAGRLI